LNTIGALSCDSTKFFVNTEKSHRGNGFGASTS
jgi:hypothetical protein